MDDRRAADGVGWLPPKGNLNCDESLVRVRLTKDGENNGQGVLGGLLSVNLRRHSRREIHQDRCSCCSRCGRRFLARGVAAKAYEHGLKERTVVVEFESLDKAIAAHDGSEYQAALAVLGNGAERDLRIVEGIDE